MSLKDDLFADLKQAMKDKDALRKNTIQSVRTAVLQEEKDTQSTLYDDDVIRVVASQIKKRKSALPEFEKSGRDELIQELKDEIQLLESYLPEQMSEDDLVELIDSVISETQAESMKDMGKVMGLMTQKANGRADNKTISQIVKRKLSN